MHALLGVTLENDGEWIKCKQDEPKMQTGPEERQLF
jgi:hypothetical protein